MAGARPDYRISPKYMRRDLIVGLLVSTSLLGGVAWLGEVFRHGPPKIIHKKEPPAIEIVMPPPPPPDEVVDDTQQQDVKPADIAPPMQQDVPQIVTETSFVQRLEPPPPQGLTINRSAITVPVGAGGYAKGGQIFDLSMLDKQPVPTYQPKPNYPYEMKKQGISGRVVVEFLLGPDGTVHDAYAVSSTQHEFESSAIEAVSRWRFRPGMKGGRPVTTRMEVPIDFTLSNDD